jgi:hypothetical protein
MPDTRLIDSTLAKSEVTAPDGTEVFRAIIDPAGTPVSRWITLTRIKNFVMSFIEARTISAAGLATGGGDLSANRTITVPAEDAAGFRTGTATNEALTAGGVYSAADIVSLTDAATIAVDMATFINATVTLGGNRTLGAPSNPKVGQSGTIYIVQDGTGSRTLAFHANYKFAGGTAPTVTPAASAVTALHYKVRSSTFIEISAALDVK